MGAVARPHREIEAVDAGFLHSDDPLEAVGGGYRERYDLAFVNERLDSDQDAEIEIDLTRQYRAYVLIRRVVWDVRYINSGNELKLYGQKVSRAAAHDQS